MADPKLEVRDVTDEDIAYVARWMRERDKLEVWASDRMEPLEAIKESVHLSHFVKVFVIDGKPAAIYGVADLQPNLVGTRFGVPWVLTTEVVSRNPREFIRASRRILPTLFNGYDVLLNYVDVRYVSAVRWLKSLGFWVGAPVPFGVAGELFHPFVLKKDDFHV